MHNGVKWFLKRHSNFFHLIVSIWVSFDKITNYCKHWMIIFDENASAWKQARYFKKDCTPLCRTLCVCVRIRAQPAGNGFFRINLKWWKLNTPRFYSNQNFLSNCRALLKVMAVKLDSSFKLLAVYIQGHLDSF